MIKKDTSSEKGLADGVSSYEEVKQELEKVLVHLQNLSSPALQSETGGIDEVSYLMLFNSTAILSQISNRNNGWNTWQTLTFQAHTQKR